MSDSNQQAVAYLIEYANGESEVRFQPNGWGDVVTPLYLHPAPQRVGPEQKSVNWRNVLPGGRITDKWDSARVGDYNQGWNDYRKAARDALEKAHPAPDDTELLRQALEALQAAVKLAHATGWSGGTKTIETIAALRERLTGVTNPPVGEESK